MILTPNKKLRKNELTQLNREIDWYKESLKTMN